MNLKRICAGLAAWVWLVTLAQADDGSLAAIFTNSPNAQHTVVPRRGSIIFIACHGLALGDLSCYGQTNFQTPNLDRLAAEGMRFTDYRTTSDDFSEAEAALMAGNTAAFRPGQATLAARLQAVGYHTGLIGEWTLGAQPWAQGFQEFTGFLSEEEARNYFSDYVWRHDPASRHDGREEIYKNTGGQKGWFIPDLFLTAAEAFARVNQPDFANHFRPFFLLVNLPVPESVTPGKDDYPVPTDAPYSDENWPQAAKNRAALMTRLDAGVGHLYEQLNKLGMTNNVAIFLAGAAAPEPFADTKLNFLKVNGEVRGGQLDDRLRAPMIVHWPGHVPAGQVSAERWSAPDFAPTAMQIAYGKQAPDFTGNSVLPVLFGTPGTNTPALPDRPDHTGQP